MKLVAKNLGKRFGTNWIFRNINLNMVVGEKIAISGINGSGKSTLLKLLAGLELANEGDIHLEGMNSKKKTKPAQFYRYIGFSAPYQEIPEELDMSQLLKWQKKIQPTSLGEDWLYSTICKSGLANHLNKKIANYSSGMKQKAKFILALHLNRPIIILDEPTSNLDKQSEAWLLSTIFSLKGKIILIASNKKSEVTLCDKQITLKVEEA